MTRRELQQVLGWAIYVKTDQEANGEYGWDEEDAALYKKLVHEFRLSPPLLQKEEK